MENYNRDSYLAKRDAFRMYDNVPELSPDLEWMLKSNQVSDDLILESLIDEYLGPVYALFVSLQIDHDRIPWALSETFADVLIERKRLDDDLNVESFIYSLAVRVCERNKLGQLNRRPARLHHSEDMPHDHLPEGYLSLVTGHTRSLLERKERSSQRLAKLTQGLLVGLVAVLLVTIGWITNRIAVLETSSPLTRRTIVETQIVRITVIVTHTPVPPSSPGAAQPLKGKDFDPASSQLAFQWQEAGPAQIEGTQSVPVDVYADGYYLGQVQVSDPWSSSCERSPDGRYLALVERPDLPPFPFSKLHLLQIQGLESVVGPLPKGSRYGNDVAFSPDSRHLAFWGCSGSSGCGVYVLDLSSKEAEMLFPGRYAGYFVWSPDGEEIAMLSATGRFLVIDASNGKITYEHAVDWVKKDIPREAPIHDWGDGYPPVQSDLRGCENPVVS